MSVDSKWIRLNCDWMESEWVCDLSAESRLAWIQFLLRVKTHGSRGGMKTVPIHVLARHWLVSEEAVAKMIEAATDSGAIVERDGQWIVSAWRSFQVDDSSAERQARFKEKQKQEVTPSNAGNALPPLPTVSNAEVTQGNAGNAYKDKDKDIYILPPPTPSGENGQVQVQVQEHSSLQADLDAAWTAYPAKDKFAATPGRHKAHLKVILMEPGMKPPEAHRAEVLAGIRRMAAHFEARGPSAAQYVPSPRQFRDQQLWLEPWEIPPPPATAQPGEVTEAQARMLGEQHADQLSFTGQERKVFVERYVCRKLGRPIPDWAKDPEEASLAG